MLASMPANLSAFLLLAGVVLALTTWPYVNLIKPRKEPLFGSYLVFAFVYGLSGAVLFSVGSSALAALNLAQYLYDWPAALAFVAYVLLPPFFLATLATKTPLKVDHFPQ